MKKIIIALAVGIASFAAGLFGIYYALPSLAPEHVEQLQAQGDSLAEAGQAPPAPADKPPLSPAFRVSGPLLDSLLQNSGEPVNDISSLQKVVLAALEDSLAVLQTRMEGAARSRDSLQKELIGLQEKLQKRETVRADAAGLGSTLAKLEGKELRAILQQIDMDILEALYTEATERNRTKLMQNMPPEYAARFLQRMIRPGGTPTTRAADRSPAADSTAQAKQ